MTQEKGGREVVVGSINNEYYHARETYAANPDFINIELDESV